MSIKIWFIPSQCSGKSPTRPYVSQFWCYQRFAKTVPASSFGELIPQPTLLKAYKVMSNQKTIPKGLHKQKVEQGHIKKPPIPYIPVDNKIGNKVKSEARTFKVKIDNKTTVNAAV